MLLACNPEKTTIVGLFVSGVIMRLGTHEGIAGFIHRISTDGGWIGARKPPKSWGLYHGS